jgi:2-polyprenyl-3-methyl-5-hydroxy-6-metoxy-1,4-benzoquinol methylase
VKRLEPDSGWPESWLAVYEYDRIEVYGDRSPRAAPHARAYRSRMAETIALVEESVEPRARILDVAAAQGNLTLALAERGYVVTWKRLASGPGRLR